MIIAGDDRVANARVARHLVGQIRPDLITELIYEENYHENFNELNREEVFTEIVAWTEEYVR
jgi:alpha-beta hydrolase superfamily lysophospholipase